MRIDEYKVVGDTIKELDELEVRLFELQDHWRRFAVDGELIDKVILFNVCRINSALSEIKIAKTELQRIE